MNKTLTLLEGLRLDEGDATERMLKELLKHSLFGHEMFILNTANPEGLYRLKDDKTGFEQYSLKSLRYELDQLIKWIDERKD